MVLEPDAVQVLFYQIGSEFAVGCGHGEQLGTGNSLRSTAFIDVDMGGLGTDDGVVRTQHGVDTQHVGPRAVENGIYSGLLAEMTFYLLSQSDGIFVLAVSQSMDGVGLAYRLKYFGRDARMIVASKSTIHKK